MFGSWIPQLVSFLSAYIYEVIVSVNSFIIVSMNSYKCGILIFSQEQVSRKKELFVMALRTPMGKTIPGNYTIIPLSKKWVFHAIFRLAFVELCGKKVCSLNRLVLTDEEDAEYRSFKTMIAT
jgi:hypothetical protein